MTQKFKIGIDIGTTSTKAILYDEHFEVVDAASKEYLTIREKMGMAEQNPDLILAAVQSVIKRLIEQTYPQSKKITTLSFSSAMHSLMIVSTEGEPLTPLYTWADNQSSFQLEKAKAVQDLDWVYKKTGTPIHPMSPFSKLLWLQADSPELLVGGNRIIGIKEYITYFLTGELKVDYSIASATGLFNLQSLDWDPDIISFLGIEQEVLSDPVDTNYVFKRINPVAYKEIGLSLETQIIIGASDGCLANLGLNAIANNEVAMTIGTSGAVRMVSDHIVLDPEGRTFCYYLAKDKWVIGGAVNNGGNAFEWFASILSKTEVMNYDEINNLMETIQPGADGLLFFPYLNGERSPLWDASVQAHFIGLSANHTTGHLIRAVMEGVLYNLVEVLNILETNAGPAKKLKVNGGFLRSAFWKQMAADIFNKTLTITPQFESSCLGAVLIDQMDYLEELKKMRVIEVIPIEENVKAYQKSYELYQKLSIPIQQIHEIKANHRNN